MTTTLPGYSPTDAGGAPFVGGVTPADGVMHPLEGSTTTAITGSPSSASAVRLVVDARDGGIAATANTALTSPPTNTNAGSETLLTFAAQVHHWTMQNNSSVTVYYHLDATASTASFQLLPGAHEWWDWPLTVLHVYTVSAVPVNGAAGLVLIGRA